MNDDTKDALQCIVAGIALGIWLVILGISLTRHAG